MLTSRSAVRRIVAGLLLVVAVLAGQTSGAQAYPPSGPILVLSDRDLPPNTPFVATVVGCTIGEDVTFFLVDNPPSTVKCVDDGSGQGVATTTLISPANAGTYQVRAVLATTGVTLFDSIRVSVSNRPIPRAGSSGVAPTSLMGAGLIVLGAAFMLVARHRRRDAAAAAS